MKIWVDDLRKPPYGYYHVYSVNDAKSVIEKAEKENQIIEIIDLDHDAGDYAVFGGDYINLLDWLVETSRSYPIHIHTMNVVGRMNMERLCHRHGLNLVFN